MATSTTIRPAASQSPLPLRSCRTPSPTPSSSLLPLSALPNCARHNTLRSVLFGVVLVWCLSPCFLLDLVVSPAAFTLSPTSVQRDFVFCVLPCCCASSSFSYRKVVAAPPTSFCLVPLLVLWCPSAWSLFLILLGTQFAGTVLTWVILAVLGGVAQDGLLHFFNCRFCLSTSVSSVSVE